jgi:hypothetical protein
MVNPAAIPIMLLQQFRFGKKPLGGFLKSSNFNDQLNQHKVPPHFHSLT